MCCSQGGVRIGGAELVVALPPVTVAHDRAVRLPVLRDPVVHPFVLRLELALSGRGQGDGVGTRGRSRLVVCSLGFGGTLAPEEPAQVGIGGEPGYPALHGGVSLDLGRVEEELLAPHQPGIDALLHDPLEEATEDLQAGSTEGLPP